MTEIISFGKITNNIFVIKGLKVTVDVNLAQIYDVETKRLKEQVKRNADRFPSDFMIALTKEEVKNLRSQDSKLNLEKRTKVILKILKHSKISGQFYILEKKEKNSTWYSKMNYQVLEK